MSESFDFRRLIDEICIQYEDAWTAQGSLDIGPWLLRVPEEHRSELLREVLHVDFELRTKSSQAVTPEDYQALGDEAMSIIARLLERGSFSQREHFQFGQTKAVTQGTTPDWTGRQIGPYKLLRVIGKGGMGEVWKAEQSEPVKRRVALKVIKSGVDSKEFIARFEGERQALSLMNHPNIARILDAGTTAEGQPWYAMELVEGQTLVEYCDQNRLGINDRLQLFIDICGGVQHAHQKGIIHRDLKPGNILVAVADGVAVPKVIDFGLAKAMESTERLHDQSFSGMGRVLGTLKYMSPEQANPDTIDIDTRTDIYALGVILYELLAGSTPLDEDEFKGATWLKLLEMIREREPVKPSSRLSHSGDSVTSITEARRTNVSSLNRILLGDLDWVVMKALEKDRKRRYESVSGFAADVRRYLHNEPVVARPPSFSYRVGKFVRKNRAGVLAAGLLATALIVGIIGTIWGLARALKAESLASQRFDDAEEARGEAERDREIAENRRKEAEQNLAYASKGNKILGSVFANLDTRKEYVTLAEFRNALRDNLETAVEELEGSSIGNAQAVAEMQNTLAMSLLGLEQANRAIVLLEKARATLLDELGHDHPDTLTTMDNLAVGYSFTGRLDLALPLFEQTLALRKSKLGLDHSDTLTSMNNLAEGHRALGQLDKALPLYEQAFELSKSKLGPDHPLTLATMNNLAEGYRVGGHLEKALPLYQETWELMKSKLGPLHPDTLTSMGNLATGYHFAGQIETALPLFEQSLELRRSQLGAEHPATLASMNNLAAGYMAAGQLDKALPLYERTFKLRQTILGFDHPETLSAMNSLAEGYRVAGLLNEALPLMEQTLELSQAKLGPDHPNTLTTMNNLALAYEADGQIEKALPMFEQTLELRKSKLGLDHPATLGSIGNLAMVYHRAGHLDKALPLHEQALELKKSKLGIDHPETLTSMNNLALGYKEAGQSDKARSLYEHTLQLSKSKLGSDHPDTLIAMENLALCYCDAGQINRALTLLKKTLVLTESKFGPDHPATLTNKSNLATVYQVSGQSDKALPMMEEVVEQRKSTLGLDHPDTLSTMNNLAEGYRTIGRLGKALPLLAQTLELRKSKLGLDHPDTLSSMHNLALGYQDAGDVEDKALPLLEQTLELTKAKLGPSHAKTLNCTNSLAFAYHKINQLEKALPIYQKALEMRKSELGLDHPDTFVSINNLAGCYYDSGQFEKALPLFEHAMDLMKSNRGVDDPATLQSANNLALVLQVTGKLDRALPLYEQNLELSMSILGADHPLTMTSMGNLGACYQAAGQLDKAIPLMERSLELVKSRFGTDHFNTLTSMNKLAMGYKAAGQLERALPLFEAASVGMEKRQFRHPYAGPVISSGIEAYTTAQQFDEADRWQRKWLAFLQSQAGPESPAYAGELAGFGLSLLKRQAWEEAEKVLRECFSIREKSQPDLWTTFNTQSMLGASLLGQQKYDEAELLLIAGYEGMKARQETIPPQGNTRIPEALDRLIELYTETNNAEELEKWKSEKK